MSSVDGTGTSRRPTASGGPEHPLGAHFVALLHLGAALARINGSITAQHATWPWDAGSG
ncbi:hypothetical protein ACQEV4_01575 [Streptomyces shenzhenensis]|uniref:hypothetical protein n=1 Tax=Streptomyces shenzhenensis TaxID=943815 RepID=UPI003D8F6FE0